MASSSSRLDSLDAFRGFTIAAMVIVNNPGSRNNIYAPLEHARWNGCTLTDLVFPFFLFIVGVSITLAYSKYLESNTPLKEIHKKIILRAVKLYTIGMLIGLYFILIGSGNFNWDGIRWTGVLQRISIVFLVCAFLFLNTNWKIQAWTGGSLLVIYWILMAYIPVPGTGNPDLSGPVKNWAHYLDAFLLPGLMYRTTWDPEGIISTVPAVATGITGMLAGRMILNINDKYIKVAWLFFAGFCSFSSGELWNQFFPINKNIWTSSYVMYTSGLATMALAASILLIDIQGYRRWTKLGRVYGVNSITIYVISILLFAVFHLDLFWGHSLNSLFMGGLAVIGIAPDLSSFIYAICYMLICYIPAWLLYRKKIYIKL